MAELWPVSEARKVVDRMERLDLPADRPVLFETGFGPSGLPHIGTFAEVARTTFVRRAFTRLTEGRVPTRLISFSDDMDGLRKVPDNMPRREMIAEHLGKPLSSIPDPFGEHDSYSAHMNHKLREFLDRFGFDYEFRSSTEVYRSGAFDDVLKRVGAEHQTIVGRVTRTMRPENREGWSPFLPTCPECGRNLTPLVTGVHPEDDELSMRCIERRDLTGCGFDGRVSYLGGEAKLRWKADWALRWTALGIDYEMYGKDLNDTVRETQDICRILGGTPPEGMFYEMFLDADGSKISKSVGSGLTVDQWLRWAPLESLLLFLTANPRKARKLEPAIVPQWADQVLDRLRGWPELDEDARLDDAVSLFQEPGEEPPVWTAEVGMSLAQSLAAVLGPDPDLIHRTLERQDPRIADNEDLARRVIDRAVNYEQDFGGDRDRRGPENEEDRELLGAFAAWLESNRSADAEAIQGAVFLIARERGVKPPRLFRLLYRGLLGTDRGPRIGSFTLLLGRDEMIRRVKELLGATADGGRDP